MTVKGISLFSGGLDSILACKVMAEQDIEISCISFETPFFSASMAKQMARQLGLALDVVDITEEHLAMLRSPIHGYGKNMNPCIDCRELMFRIAGRIMREREVDFLFTGEIVGQRPMSQGKNRLLMTAKNAGLAGLILRPLSARLLPETEPERDGRIDRGRLLDLQGRGRKRQTEMAAAYGIKSWPPPAGGCLLTEQVFSRRLRDLFDHQPGYTIRDIELLKVGRHFRLGEGVKAIVGRNASENSIIDALRQQGDALIKGDGFPGPTVLVTGGGNQETRTLACRLCLRYGDAPREREASVICVVDEDSSLLKTTALTPEQSEAMLV